jgi:hypothetical protein
MTVTTARNVAEVEGLIRARAHERVASIFAVDPKTLRPSLAFGKDLKCTFVSDFRSNEFDRLDRDIKDVADRKTRQRLGEGELVIRTVGDYCDHMVACFATNPDEVARLLDLNR